MKKLLIYQLFFLVITLLGCTGQDQKGSIRVMTFNIRYDNPSDGINSWDNRKDLLLETIIEASPDVIGMQEVLEQQLVYLDTLLPWYDFVGVGRNDGKTGGEFVPIFYKMNRLDLQESGTFWLSEYPDSIGSVGWDAALPRIATWARFYDKHIRKEFLFINTHFDHMGEMARKKSARLIDEFVQNSDPGIPVVITGDFNCDDQSEPYHFLTQQSSTLWKDSYKNTILKPTGGPGTFNGFGSESNPPRIDFIFCDKNWTIFEHHVLEVKEKEMYVSDHYPVLGIIKKMPGTPKH